MRKLLCLCTLLLVALFSFAQQKILSGTISDKDKRPLPSVSVQTSTRSTVSDEKGHFSIPVSTGEVVTFSYIGRKPHQLIVSESDVNININLEEDPQNLNEVVVLGYTTNSG